jgi:hypothetical protein
MKPYYIWKTGDTWWKVAYKKYGDETRYRDIIEANPQFSPVRLPTPGTRLDIPTTLPDTPQSRTVESDPTQYYFPWVDPNEYYRRLYDYNGIALWFVNDINGPVIG